jgi:hypothetical protein
VIRIFFSLSLISLLCLAAALFLGLSIGDLQAVADSKLPDSAHQTVLDRASAHRLAGLAAALVVILVNSIAVTYFIGTSRWCKEVVERYSLDAELFRRSQALKRRTFPWAALNMLAMIGVVALGAAADPGTGIENTAVWVMPHFLAGLAAIPLAALSFFVQATNMRTHYDVINVIMAEVRTIRTQRELEV